MPYLFPESPMTTPYLTVQPTDVFTSSILYKCCKLYVQVEDHYLPIWWHISCSHCGVPSNPLRRCGHIGRVVRAIKLWQADFPGPSTLKELCSIYDWAQTIQEDKPNTIQHSYSKAPVELEPKFGQIIHKTNPTYYNTVTPRLK